MSDVAVSTTDSVDHHGHKARQLRYYYAKEIDAIIKHNGTSCNLICSAPATFAYSYFFYVIMFGCQAFTIRRRGLEVMHIKRFGTSPKEHIPHEQICCRQGVPKHIMQGVKMPVNDSQPTCGSQGVSALWPRCTSRSFRISLT